MKRELELRSQVFSSPAACDLRHFSTLRYSSEFLVYVGGVKHGKLH